MRIVSFRGLVVAGVALLAVAFACALATASALAQTAYAPSQAGITVFDPGTMLATGTPIATGSAPERVAAGKAIFKRTRKIAGKSTVSYPSLKLIH